MTTTASQDKEYNNTEAESQETTATNMSESNLRSQEDSSSQYESDGDQYQSEPEPTKRAGSKYRNPNRTEPNHYDQQPTMLIADRIELSASNSKYGREDDTRLVIIPPQTMNNNKLTNYQPIIIQNTPGDINNIIINEPIRIYSVPQDNSPGEYSLEDNRNARHRSAHSIESESGPRSHSKQRACKERTPHAYYSESDSERTRKSNVEFVKAQKRKEKEAKHSSRVGKYCEPEDLQYEDCGYTRNATVDHKDQPYTSNLQDSVISTTSNRAESTMGASRIASSDGVRGGGKEGDAKKSSPRIANIKVNITMNRNQMQEFSSDANQDKNNTLLEKLKSEMSVDFKASEMKMKSTPHVVNPKPALDTSVKVKPKPSQQATVITASRPDMTVKHLKTSPSEMVPASTLHENKPHPYTIHSTTISFENIHKAESVKAIWTSKDDDNYKHGHPPKGGKVADFKIQPSVPNVTPLLTPKPAADLATPTTPAKDQLVSNTAKPAEKEVAVEDKVKRSSLEKANPPQQPSSANRSVADLNTSHQLTKTAGSPSKASFIGKPSISAIDNLSLKSPVKSDHKSDLITKMKSSIQEDLQKKASVDIVSANKKDIIGNTISKASIQPDMTKKSGNLTPANKVASAKLETNTKSGNLIKANDNKKPLIESNKKSGNLAPNSTSQKLETNKKSGNLTPANDKNTPKIDANKTTGNVPPNTLSAQKNDSKTKSGNMIPNDKKSPKVETNKKAENLAPTKSSASAKVETNKKSGNTTPANAKNAPKVETSKKSGNVAPSNTSKKLETNKKPENMTKGSNSLKKS